MNDDPRKREGEPPKNLGGRPTKMRPEVVRQLIENIKICMPFELACKAAGISYGAFRGWMRKGEAAKSGKFFKFVKDIHAAESAAMTGCLATIVSAVSKSGNWKAAAWILERRHSEFFSRQRLELQLGDKPGTFEALLAQLFEVQAQRGAPPATPAGDVIPDDEKPLSAGDSNEDLPDA